MYRAGVTSGVICRRNFLLKRSEKPEAACDPAAQNVVNISGIMSRCDSSSRSGMGSRKTTKMFDSFRAPARIPGLGEFGPIRPPFRAAIALEQ